MLKQYIFAACVGFALVGCAGDENDPMQTEADAGFAGSASMGGIDGVAGKRAAGSGGSNETPAAGTSAGSGDAGSGGDGAVAAGAGGSTSVAGAGSSIGGKGGAGAGAGSSGSAGSVAGAGGAGAGGSAQPACPDADADGVCNADDKCPAGSDVDANSNGYADACEKKLWEVTQHLDQSFSYPSNQANVDTILLRLTSSGAGCTASTYTSRTLGVGSEYDALLQGFTFDKITNGTELAGNPTVAEAWLGCSEFTPSINLQNQSPVLGTKSVQQAKHVAYLHATGYAKLVDHQPSSSYYTVTVDVTWTAYGY